MPGLLKRTPVTAAAFLCIGKAKDRHWEHGEDISLIESETVGYTREETDRLGADPTLMVAVRQAQTRPFARVTGVSENTAKVAGRGRRTRRLISERLKIVARELMDKAV